MNNDRFVYVDIPLVQDNGNYTYGEASKSSGDILFEMNALEGSEAFSSYADMKENYDKDYIVINLLRDVKVPIARVNITDADDPNSKATQYLLISNVSCGVPFFNRTNDSDLTCYCSGETLVNSGNYPGMYINMDKTVGFDGRE